MSANPKDDLVAALTCEVHRLPTRECALHNYELPVTREDMGLLDEMIQHPERFVLKPRYDGLGRGVPWCSATCPRYDRRHDLCRLSEYASDGEGGNVCIPMVQQMSKNGSAIHRRCQKAESKLGSSQRQHRGALRLLQEILEPTCVVCECTLAEPPMNLGDDAPPHCQDCVLEPEHLDRWENETRPVLRARIKAAMSLEPKDGAPEAAAASCAPPPGDVPAAPAAELHLFQMDGTYVAASSVDDAWAVFEHDIGESRDDYESDDYRWEQVPDDEVLRVWLDDSDFSTCDCRRRHKERQDEIAAAAKVINSLPKGCPREELWPGLPKPLDRDPSGHVRPCPNGYVAKTCREWAAEGRGVVCSTDW